MANVFNTLVRDFSLRCRGINASDLVDGCPVKITQINNTATVSVIVPMTVWTESKDLIINEMKNIKAPKPAYRNGQLVFTLTNPRLVQEQYTKVKTLIGRYAAPYAQTATCPYCGQGNCDTAGLKGNVFVKMHSTCQANDLTGKKSNVAGGTQHAFLGIIGAILFGLIPYIISFLTVSFGNTVFYILFIGAPFLTALGFIAFKGGYGQAATAICTILNLALFFVYCYFDCAYIIKDWYDVSFGEALGHPVDVLDLLKSSDYIKNRALVFVLYIIGMIIFVGSKPLASENKMKEIENVRALNIPLDQVNQFQSQTNNEISKFF